MAKSKEDVISEDIKNTISKDPPAEIDKSLTTTIQSEWITIKEQQEAELAKGKPKFSALDKPIVEGEVSRQNNEYLRPDGRRGYFTEFFTKKGDIVYCVIVDSDPDSEFNKDWFIVEAS